MNRKLEEKSKTSKFLQSVSLRSLSCWLSNKLDLAMHHYPASKSYLAESEVIERNTCTPQFEAVEAAASVSSSSPTELISNAGISTFCISSLLLIGRSLPHLKMQKSFSYFKTNGNGNKSEKSVILLS